MSMKFAIITLFLHLIYFFFPFYSGGLFNVCNTEQTLFAKFNMRVLIAV